MPGKLWTQEEIKFLKQNYAKLGPKKCTLLINRSYDAIMFKAHVLKLAIHKAWSNEEIEFLQAHYPKLGNKGCSKQLGRSLMSTYRKAKRLGLHEAIPAKDFFKIWSPEMAYVLGLFCADGGLTWNPIPRFCIALKSSDQDLLKKMAISMGLEPLRYLTFRTERTSEMAHFRFPATHIWQDLEKLGIPMHDKSHQLTWIDIPSEFLHHFVRGHFDGDGSVRNRGNSRYVTIYGTESFLLGLFTTLQRMGLKPHGPRIHHGMLYYLYFTKEETVKFAAWIYQDATLYLERKFKQLEICLD